MRAENDDVGRFSTCSRDDRFGGVSFPDQERRAQSAVLSFSHNSGDGSFSPAPFLVDSQSETATWEPQTRRLDDGQHEQLGGIPRGGADRLLRSGLGDSRQIRREQDAPQTHPG